MEKCKWCKKRIFPLIQTKIFQNGKDYFHGNCWIEKENMFIKAMQEGKPEVLDHIWKKLFD